MEVNRLFLETIIALLVIANIYLFLKPQRRGSAFGNGNPGTGIITSAFDEGLAESSESMAETRNSGPGGTVTLQKELAIGGTELTSLKERVAEIGAKQDGMERRLEFVSKKVQGIDDLLEDGAKKKISDLGIMDKFNRIEEFRRQAIIEIEALKQKTPSEKKKGDEKFDAHLEKKIHKLIFHANKDN